MSRAVTIRAVDPADLPVLYLQQLDPEATRMADFPSRDRDAFFAHWKKILADRSVWNRTILYGDDVAGHVACFGPSDERLIGYWIGREYWGKGIATRALELLLQEVPERPIFAHVAKHNTGSIRVLEKCGFVAAGGDTTETGAGELVYRLD
jgi:RimJ/RimL family protein N-acetyltransferase